MEVISQAHLEAVCGSIDQLVAVEIRMQGQAVGVIPKLAEAARRAAGRSPLFAAATALRARIRPGDAVLITTGTGLPPYLPAGETDGPPGAAALARALQLALGARPVLLSEAAFLPPIEAASLAMGFRGVPWSVASRIPFTVAIEEFPVEGDGRQKATSLLDMYQPRAVIAVERTGPNRVGVRHSSTGMAGVDPYLGRMEELIKEARVREILTIGIGDNGNEIGFGVIEEAVRAYKPFGDRCQCPCGQGIADHTHVDMLIAASVSNWGAYGLAAALALLQQDPSLTHSPDDELRVVLACTAAGAVDGATGSATPTVDGVPTQTLIDVVQLLQAIVRQGLRTRKRDF